MTTGLHNLSRVHHVDAIRPDDGRQAVGDDNRGATKSDVGQRPFDGRLGLVVDC